MKDFLKNVLANIVAIMIFFGFFFVLMFVFMIVGSVMESSKTTVKANSVLTLDFKSNIIDSPTETNDNIFDFKPDKKDVLLYDAIEAINRAKTDDRIKGISIEMDGTAAGITQLDDLRSALENFKKSGKFVYSYGNVVSQPGYYLGSVAQQYFLNPAGGIDLKGLSAEVTFMKNFAEKYGIGIEVIRHGKYKAAVEPFIRNDLSPENKEQLSTILNDIWSDTSSKISRSRKIDGTTFRTVVDSLYAMLPENSVKYGLVDKLAQKTEYENFIKKQLKIDVDKKIEKISIADYANDADKNSAGDGVAVLYASGDIVNGEEYDGIQSRRYVKEIQKLQKDARIKAVVLRVNSPGGSANAADEILFELKQLNTKKPVIVSFGDYAASGGYYIAMAGRRIFTERNTLTGSIGVFGIIPNVRELAERNGIHTEEVTTNANSNGISFINGISPGAKSILNQSIEQTYRRFVGFVMQNRKKSFQQVDELGGGRVWSGSRAQELGLADEVGTLQNAVAFAAKEARLKDYSVEAFPKKRSKFEQLFKDIDEEDLAVKLLGSKFNAEQLKNLKLLLNEESGNGLMMQTLFKVNIK